ncbi:MAG: hypothetical protein GX345_02550 [Clostridiales bacterium]|nr:hypothetical protein [Clostridiales bacterium]
MKANEETHTSSLSDEGQAKGDKSPLNVNKLVLGAVSALLILFALIAWHRHTNPAAENQYSIVYSSQGQLFLQSDRGKFEAEFSEGSLPVLSQNSSIALYTTVSKREKDALDLYCCQMTDKRQVKRGGKVIDTGKIGDFKINDSGSLVSYLKKDKETGRTDFFLYDTKNKKSRKIDSNVKEVFLAPRGLTAYYTKKREEFSRLYKINFKDPESALLSEDAKKIDFFSDAGTYSIIFETPGADSSLSTLNFIKDDGEINEICKNSQEALLEYYSSGANLYFLTPSELEDDKTSLIEDDLKETDSKINEPNPKDYLFVFGYSYGYRKDKIAYEEKLKRDELRQAIYGDFDYKNDSSPTSNCYVFNPGKGEASLIAENVSPDSLLALASDSKKPLAIFKDYSHSGEKKSFSHFSQMLPTKSTDEILVLVSDFLREANAYKGIKLCSEGNPQGMKLEFPEENLAESEFILEKNGSNFLIFTKKDETFFLDEVAIGKKKLLPPETIDDNILSYDRAGDVLWFISAAQGGEAGSLNRYEAGEIKPMLQECNYFFSFKNGSALALKNVKHQSGNSFADLYFVDGEKASFVDEKVDLHSLRFGKDNDIAFITNNDDSVGGQLKIYKKNSLNVLTDGVFEILVY